MTRPRIALAAVLAATVAAGCGAGAQPSQDFTGAEEDVAKVVEELESAAQREEPTRICTEILSTALSRDLGKECTATVQTAIDDADIYALSADEVQISGTRARVRVEVGNDGERKEQLELVRQTPGGWRIDSFGGTVR
jgi:hypothetical protein